MIMKNGNKGVELLEEGKPIAYRIKRERLCTVNTSKISCAALLAQAADLEIGHARLGHIHSPKIRQMAKS